MFGWFKKKTKDVFIEKDVFVLVKVLSYNIRMMAKDYMHRDGTICFYLYESKKCKRTMEAKVSIDLHYALNVELISPYLEIVYPWLQGQNNKDIPSYWQVVKEKRKDDIMQMYRRVYNK
ncbi:MAG: hypothetical protein WC523_04530 [Patescibacteria group bacterium]